MEAKVMNPYLIALMAGIAATIYGIIGYWKNAARKTFERETEEFNQGKFWISVIGTILIGLLANFLGLTPEALSSATFGVVLTQLLRKLWTILLG